MSDGSTPPFGFAEQIEVCTDSNCSTPVSDAQVEVNDTTVPWNATDERYVGTVLVGAGASLTLSVTVGATTYSVTGVQFTTAPTISAPTSGATWNDTATNSITWSGGAPTAGAAYFVGVASSGGSFVFPAGDDGPLEVPISTTTQSVPAGTLSPGSYAVVVGIGSQGLVGQSSGGLTIPGAAAGSGLWLGLVRPLVPITVN